MSSPPYSTLLQYCRASIVVVPNWHARRVADNKNTAYNKVSIGLRHSYKLRDSVAEMMVKELTYNKINLQFLREYVNNFCFDQG